MGECPGCQPDQPGESQQLLAIDGISCRRSRQPAIIYWRRGLRQGRPMLRPGQSGEGNFASLLTTTLKTQKLSYPNHTIHWLHDPFWLRPMRVQAGPIPELDSMFVPSPDSPGLLRHHYCLQVTSRWSKKLGLTIFRSRHNCRSNPDYG